MAFAALGDLRRVANTIQTFDQFARNSCETAFIAILRFVLDREQFNATVERICTGTRQDVAVTRPYADVVVALPRNGFSTQWVRNTKVCPRNSLSFSHS
jgi:hypothetical protein